MAVITPDTFDPLNRYVAVRFAQGTPMCDCDLNEWTDIVRHELRTILRDVVGDGAPAASDGFRVTGTGADADVTVEAGPPGPARGVLLAEGHVVRLPADGTLRGQPLHASRPGAAALAARLGTVVVPEIPTPAADGTILIYLDVWERLLEAAEEPTLVLPALGVESSARLRQEFAVRWRDGAAVPASGDADFEAGHAYLPLASVARRSGDDAIEAADVTDLRRRRVATPSRADFEQIAADAFGAGYAVDGGAPRLDFALRDVINAMLSDGRAAILGPETINSAAPNFPALAYSPEGLRRFYWIGDAAAPGARAVISQTERADGSFAAPVEEFEVTGGLSAGSLSVVAQPDGAVWAVYQGDIGGGTDEILARRRLGGVWAAEITLSSGGDNANPVAALDAAGAVHAVWRDTSSGTEIASAQIPLGSATADAAQVADAAAAGNVVFALARAPEGGVRLVKAEGVGGPPLLWSFETKRWDSGAWEGAFTPVADTVSAFSLDLAAALAPTGEVALAFATTFDPSTFDLEIARLEVAPGGFQVSDRRRLVRATTADPSQIPLQPILTPDPQGNLRLVLRTQTDLRAYALVYRV